jgi:hypothetical protein
MSQSLQGRYVQVHTIVLSFEAHTHCLSLHGSAGGLFVLFVALFVLKPQLPPSLNAHLMQPRRNNLVETNSHNSLLQFGVLYNQFVCESVVPLSESPALVSSAPVLVFANCVRIPPPGWR